MHGLVRLIRIFQCTKHIVKKWGYQIKEVDNLILGFLKMISISKQHRMQ